MRISWRWLEAAIETNSKQDLASSIRLYSNISEHRLQPSTFGQQDKTSRGMVPYLRDTTWSTHFGRETINTILFEIAASSVAVFSFHMKIATVTRTTRLSSSNCTAFPLPPSLPPRPGRIRLRPCSPLLPVSPPTAHHITNENQTTGARDTQGARGGLLKSIMYLWHAVRCWVQRCYWIKH